MRLASICSKVILYGKSGSSQRIMVLTLYTFSMRRQRLGSTFSSNDLVWVNSVLSSSTLTAWRGWCLQMREMCSGDVTQMGLDGLGWAVDKCWLLTVQLGTHRQWLPSVSAHSIVCTSTCAEHGWLEEKSRLCKGRQMERHRKSAGWSVKELAKEQTLCTVRVTSACPQCPQAIY